MKKILKLITGMAGGLLLLLVISASTFAETPTSDITMVVGSSCYIYSGQKATTANRTDYVTFGQEIEVKNLGDTWATITYGGKTRYILSKNLEYETYTVVKNRVMVSPGAYACSASSTKGYVFYGTEVSILGESVTSKGVTYVHCLVPETYTAEGQIKSGNVEGYINKEYLTYTGTPKVVNGGTPLYANAYGASSPDSLKKQVGYITTGEEVTMLMKNGTWSKILYEGKEYYMSTSRLDALKLQIMVNRAAQTVDAKPGSGWQHYVYWNSSITVLNTYESDTYGTYYYCKIDDDYGFVREYSGSGLQYVGYNTEMVTTQTTSLYEKADENAKVLSPLILDTPVTVEYVSGSWARVNVNGSTGYILADKLEYPSYNANGSCYSTAYRLYKGNKSGTLNEKVKLLAKNSKYGYAYVQTAGGAYRWMKLSDLTAINSNERCYVAVYGVTLHKSASNESEEFMVPYMTELTLVNATVTSTGWIKVNYEGGTYYLWQNAGDGLLTNTKSNYTYTTYNEYQKKVVEKALYIYNNWKTVYAHGQSNGVANADGTYGFDCSGYASYVLNTVMQEYVPVYGISANLQTLYTMEGIYNKGYAGEQNAATVCRGGNLDEAVLQPGDILYFYLDSEAESGSDTSTINHCGIYLGNGEFIHSTHSWNGGVRIMPLNSIYEAGFVEAKRYLPEKAVSADQKMYTNNSVTYVYNEMDSNGTPAAALPAESEVNVLYTDNGNWAYVEYETGSHGYVLVKYLVPEIGEASEIRYVVPAELKLYTDAATDSDYITVPVSTEVSCLGRYGTGSYYKVVYNNTKYYVYAPNGIDSRLTTDLDRLMEGTGTMTVTANTYLRTSMNSASTDNKIKLARAKEIVTVVAVSDSGTWSYVRLSDGTYGYILSKYLQ